MSLKPTLRLRRMDHGADLPLPAYETDAAAGMDLMAAVPEGQPIILPPLGRAAVPTGLIIELPSGHEGQVRPRSGLAAKHGITVLNAPGTVDADYRGEVKVLLINLGGEPLAVSGGLRIAGRVVAPVAQVAREEGGRCSVTAGGAGGFGAAGMAARR
mgnify:CR=1 FL=1